MGNKRMKEKQKENRKSNKNMEYLVQVIRI